MKQQTAVEWLAEKLLEHAYKNEFDPYYGSLEFLEKAKKLHKQELKNAWHDGFQWTSKYKNFKEFYEGTYRSDK